jgi:hypothetical protein
MMFRPGSYQTWEYPDEGPRHKRLVEMDGYTCQHCMHNVKVTKQVDVHWCKTCMGVICDRCWNKPCSPFMKRIEELEKAVEKQRLIREWV